MIEDEDHFAEKNDNWRDQRSSNYFRHFLEIKSFYVRETIKKYEK